MQIIRGEKETVQHEQEDLTPPKITPKTRKIKRKDKKMGNKDNGNCDCLFCLSKCPECGSEAIHVKFNVVWEYDNDTKNSIHTSVIEDGVEVNYNECGGWFSLNEFGADQRLKQLRKALWKSLGPFPDHNFDFNDDGHIKGTEYTYTTKITKL